MKKLLTFSLILIVLGAFSNVFAATNIGFFGIGGELGYVMPESDIDNTIGFGAVAKLGTFAPNIAFDAYVDYWGTKKEAGGNDFSWSVIGIGAYVKYEFKLDSNIKPYVGGGLGMDFLSSKAEFTNPFTGNTDETTDSASEIAFRVIGGAEMPLNDKLDGFAQLKLSFGDVDFTGICVGVIYKLK